MGWPVPSRRRGQRDSVHARPERSPPTTCSTAQALRAARVRPAAVKALPSVSAPTKRSHLYTAFLASHADGWCELWQVNRDDVLDPDFNSYIAGFATHAVPT
jgi:hypothetical protein